ncbi:MAG: putative DNA binding domain-containing protein [Lachnospiraceae bacterium]|nr:putative DNA binding domain-containing protein [Lachnospiraceae bacterium]
MVEQDLIKLINNVKASKTEDNYLELKSAKGGIPNIYNTLSSFSNQDGGGIIVFGINETDNFDICGVKDATSLRLNIQKQCKEMYPNVNAIISSAVIDGKTVVCAEVPGVDIYERPVYYKGSGVINGSYKRVGDRDEKMSPYEVYSYEAYKKRIKDDERIVEGVDETLINKALVEEYLNKVKKDRPNFQKTMTDEKVLEVMGLKHDNHWTIAGLLLFSNFPQEKFKQFSIIAMAIPGIVKGMSNEINERFLDDKRIMGPIQEMLDEAIAFVEKNSKKPIVINSDGRRITRTEYPMEAVREAILNTLVHRDYSIYTEGTPISLEMYSDRMEIKNPGGIYGNEPIENLGRVNINTRNEALANALEILGITENRYSGIPRIRQLFEEAKLKMPVFKVENGEFVVIFYNSGETKDEFRRSKRKDLEEKIINYCVKPRTRQEIVDYMNLSYFYIINVLLKGLIEKGKIELTIPDKPRSAKQRYISGGVG